MATSEYHPLILLTAYKNSNGNVMLYLFIPSRNYTVSALSGFESKSTETIEDSAFYQVKLIECSDGETLEIMKRTIEEQGKTQL
jgi:hypothetical protein